MVNGNYERTTTVDITTKKTYTHTHIYIYIPNLYGPGLRFMLKSMLVNKYIYHGFWLAGGCAASQSDARFENRWWLARILTWKSLSNPSPGYNALHYGDVIMGAIASQNTILRIVYSTVYSDAYQRKHQSSALLAFVRGIHRRSVNSLHKWPVTRKMFPFDDVIKCFVFNPNTHSPAADAGKIRDMYPHHWTPLWWGSGGKWPIVVPMSIRCQVWKSLVTSTDFDMEIS